MARFLGETSGGYTFMVTDPMIVLMQMHAPGRATAEPDLDDNF